MAQERAESSDCTSEAQTWRTVRACSSISYSTARLNVRDRGKGGA